MNTCCNGEKVCGDWELGTERVLEFFKKEKLIYDFVVKEGRVGIQLTSEPNFVYLEK